MTRFDEEIQNILKNWAWEDLDLADISIKIQNNDVRKSVYQGDAQKPVNLTIITKTMNHNLTPVDLTLKYQSIIRPFLILVATSSEEDLQRVFSNVRKALLNANGTNYWYVVSSESIEEEDGSLKKQLGIISAYKESYELIA